MKKAPLLLWIAVGLAAVLGAVWQWFPVPDAAARVHAIPLHVLGLRSREEELAPAEQTVFHGTTVEKRWVAVGGSEFILLAVDGTRNRHAIHDPAYCFRGAGWDVVSEEKVPLEGGEGRRLGLERQGAKAEALYWFSEQGEEYAGPLRYWGRTALRRLTLGRSGVEPVLVILMSVPGSIPDWNAVLQSWPEIQTL